MNTLIIWLTIIFIILPIAGKWDSIVALYPLIIHKLNMYVIRHITPTYLRLELMEGNIYYYHKGIFIGNATFRFDKPTGIAVLFPPLWICWYLITWKLKDI